MPIKLRRREFERCVERALQSIPVPFQRYLENVAIIIEAWPSEDLLHSLDMASDDLLFGYYDGVPLTDPDWSDSMRLPDRIYIFKGPIEDVCDTRKDIEEEIRLTVVHEVGHHFGLDEEQLKHV